MRTLTVVAALSAFTIGSAQPFDLTNVGSRHNTILDAFIKSGQTRITSSNYNTQITSVVDWKCNFIKAQSWTPECGDKKIYITDKLKPMLTDLYRSGDKKALWDGKVTELDSSRRLTTEQKAMFNQIRDIITNKTYTFSVAKRHLTTLKSTYQSSRLSSDKTFNELMAGCLDVAISSADYWDRNPPPPSPEPSGLAVLYADAFGYLTGWTWAVIDEIHETGDLNIANERWRITQGFWGAAIGSGGIGLL